MHEAFLSVIYVNYSIGVLHVDITSAYKYYFLLGSKFKWMIVEFPQLRSVYIK